MKLKNGEKRPEKVVIQTIKPLIIRIIVSKEFVTSKTRVSNTKIVPIFAKKN